MRYRNNINVDIQCYKRVNRNLQKRPPYLFVSLRVNELYEPLGQFVLIEPLLSKISHNCTEYLFEVSKSRNLCRLSLLQ